MGWFDSLRRLFESKPEQRFIRRTTKDKWDVDELAKRLSIDRDQLTNLTPTYRQFSIPKRSGDKRTISAPQSELKQIQRTILRRLLTRLKSHPHATGFEQGHSIVTNANIHVGSAVVLRMDIKEFFTSTSSARIRHLFRLLGWDSKASELLMKLCTYQGGLPQGAPTSPRLSNLVNYSLDVRLSVLAEKIDAAYSRYADDITFSFNTDAHDLLSVAIRLTKKILAEYGYRLHQTRKLTIRRRHQCQKVTGLVVNEQVALPRKTRRWLRAVQHHHQTGRSISLTDQQLTGWLALQNMITTQAGL